MMGWKRPLGSETGLKKPWPARDRARLLIASLLAYAVAEKAVHAAEIATLLRCHGKDFVALSDNGLLEKDGSAAVAQRADFTVNLNTGVLAYDDAPGKEWITLQKGNDQQDWVLAKSSMGQAYANNFIRLRVREEGKTIPFLMISVSSIISGTCSAAR